MFKLETKCQTCGARVVDRNLHEAWHKAIRTALVAAANEARLDVDNLGRV